LINIATIRIAVESKGVKFLHVLQPTPMTKTKLYNCEKQGLEMIEALYPGFSSVLVESYQRIRNKVAKGAGAPQAFIDLGRFTDDMDEYLYSDYVHEHHNGQLTLIIGERIARRAAPLIP